MGKLRSKLPALLAGVAYIFTVAITVAPKALAFTGGGSGTSGDPYQISTCEQLQSISEHLTAYYILTQNIDCADSSSLNSNAGFIPIGTGGNVFTGQLDGQGYAIESLTIPGSNTAQNVGIFATLDGSSVVKNLEVIGGSVYGFKNVGMIAGVMNDTSELLNVMSSARVTCLSNNGGGLVGSMQNGSAIRKSDSTGDITGNGYTYGGLVGWANGDAGQNMTLSDDYYRGNITVDGTNTHYIGGIVGFANTAIFNRVYAAGTASGDSGIGGLAGAIISSSLSDSFAAVALTHSTNTDIGPVMGSIFGTTTTANFFDTNTSGFATDPIDNTSLPVNDTSYFYDSNSAVFASWSFPSVWRENYQDYPSLVPMRAPQMLCEEAVVTTSSVHIHCIVDPPGWGTPTWLLRYRKAADSAWINVTLADQHIDEATITGLISGTDYVFQFQFTNTYGTGPWGTINATTLGSAPATTVSSIASVKGVSGSSTHYSSVDNGEVAAITQPAEAAPAADTTNESQASPKTSETNTTSTDTPKNNTNKWSLSAKTVGISVAVLVFVLAIVLLRAVTRRPSKK